MGRMLRIGLAYMDVGNLGDKVIYDTARFLVEKALRECGVREYELVAIDIGSMRKRSYKMTVLQQMKCRAIRMQIESRAFRRLPEEKKKVRLLQQWRGSQAYLYFREQEAPKLDNLDMIIFCGGGLIKYHQQNFHYFLNEITAAAEEKNIPVIINSVGVEGYDGSNPECQILKKAINRPCVRYISTRDDIKTLQEKYVTNKAIKTELVCDPALWTKECYQVEASHSNTVGLGVIRPEIFRDYMYYVNQEYLTDMYFALAQRILAAGYQVEFFCNGLDKDAAFIRHILKRYPSLKEDPRVSTRVPEATEELVKTIAGYDRFLAVRLHASIIGTALGIPNVNLVWNKKQMLFAKTIGKESNYLKKDQFDDEIIAERLLHAQMKPVEDAYRNSVYNGLLESIRGVLGEKEHA